MRAARLVVRRSRTRSALLLALFAVVAIAAFLLAGMAGYLAGAADTAVRETLTVGPAKSVAVQLTTRLAADPDQQTDAVRQVIEGAFADVEVTAHRTVRSNPAAASVGEQTTELILMADPGLLGHAALVDGDWPRTSTDAAPAAIQARAAEALDLEVGDRFSVEGVEFVVEATWLPVDVTDPYWFADPAVASGLDQLSFGPIVTDEAALAGLPVRSYAQWTIVPGGTALTADGLPGLAHALDALQLGVERADTETGLELAGTLPDRVGFVQRGLGVAGALVVIPTMLVGVIGLITIVQLCRLLVAVRRSETALLRARGASVAQLTVTSLAEAVAVIVPGSAVGSVAVIALLGSGLTPLNAAAALAAAWPKAVIVAAVSVLVCGVVCWRAAMVGAGPAVGESGRIRASVTVGTALLVVAAAGLSLWQLKLYGSPLVTGRDGVRVDPLTVIAPGLVLLALAMLVLLLFPPVARGLERWAGRAHGILPVLPVRQVARRAPVFGVALLLITLAVSGTTLTATYSQTWAAASATAAKLANGADVRVRLSPPPTVEGSATLASMAPYLRLAGVEAAATVLRTPVRIADDSIGLTAMAAERMPEVMHAVVGSVDPVLIASALHSEVTGVPVDDELRLTVRVNAEPDQQAGQVEVSAWLEDGAGSLALVSVGNTAVATETPSELTAPVPDGVWTVLAVEATLSAAEGAQAVEVTVTGFGQEDSLMLSSVEPTDRVTTYPEPQGLPVVVTEALAARLSLEAGSVISARMPSTASPIEAVVAGTTASLPANDSRLGMVADLAALNRYLLYRGERIPQPGEVWLRAAPGADLVEPAVTVSTTSATVTTVGEGSTQRVMAPALVALWWGTAGALLLAAIAVLAITSTFVQDRRGEVVVLRALGMPHSEQGRARLVELGSVALVAVVTGVISGLIASVLTVGELATTAAGAFVLVAVRFDLLGWVTLLCGFLAAVVTILTSYAGRVAHQAREAEHRGESG